MSDLQIEDFFCSDRRHFFFLLLSFFHFMLYVLDILLVLF